MRAPSMRAPSRIRTCDLLLRSNPAVDAVAISDDAGQVGGRMHCCSPSYLVIAIGDTGPTIAAKDTAWIVSQAVASSRLILAGPSAPPAAPRAVIARMRTYGGCMSEFPAQDHPRGTQPGHRHAFPSW
jgi:hypothetical protein